MISKCYDILIIKIIWSCYILLFDFTIFIEKVNIINT